MSGEFTDNELLNIMLNKKPVTLISVSGFVKWTDAKGNISKIPVVQGEPIIVPQDATVDLSNVSCNIDLGSYTATGATLNLNNSSIKNISGFVDRIDVSLQDANSIDNRFGTYSISINGIISDGVSEHSIKMNILEVSASSNCIHAYSISNDTTIEQALTDGTINTDTYVGECVYDDGCILNISNFDYGYLLITGTSLAKVKNIMDHNGFDVTDIFRTISYNSGNKALLSRFRIQFDGAENSSALSFIFKE